MYVFVGERSKFATVAGCTPTLELDTTTTRLPIENLAFTAATGTACVTGDACATTAAAAADGGACATTAATDDPEYNSRFFGSSFSIILSFI